MGNLISLLCNAKPGEKIILADNCHIMQYEAGSFAFIGGLLSTVLKTHDGFMRIEDM